MFPNWIMGWSIHDITENCQYNLVQVSEITGTGIKVSILAKLADYMAVFRSDPRRKPMEIPNGKLVRFSHMTPAHRLIYEMIQ